MLKPEVSSYLVMASSIAVPLIHWLAGLIIAAEGTNKLERCDPLAAGMRPLARFVECLKVLAWIALVLGAGGALIRPLLVVAIGGDLTFGPIFITDRVSLADMLVIGGFALLIVRSRFKEAIKS